MLTHRSKHLDAPEVRRGAARDGARVPLLRDRRRRGGGRNGKHQDARGNDQRDVVVPTAGTHREIRSINGRSGSSGTQQASTETLA